MTFRVPGDALRPSPGQAVPAAWVLLLLAYLSLVAGLQAAVSPTLELDQAEQLILAQKLAWGYTNQPPLYTWLVWGLTALTGSVVFSLWALKVALLTGFVLACDGAARCLGLGTAQRAAAVAGLALVPAVIWEAQRDLTHSLLAASIGAGVLWSALDSLNRPAWWRDARTGLLAAAALLSKHNALIFLVALPLTLACSPVTRARWRWGGLLTVAGVGALAWAPHGAWLAAHPESLNRTLQKIHGDAGAAQLMAEAFQALLGFFTPWWLLALPMAWQARRLSEAGRFLAHLAGAVVCCLLVFAVALGVDRFSPRWYFPQLFFLPLWLAAATDPAVRQWGRRLCVVGALLALVVAVALPGRVWWGGARPTRQNLPYAELAAQLRQQWGGTVPRVVLASHHLPGANLKAAWGADVLVLTPVVPWAAPLPSEVMLVARAEDLTEPRFQTWLAARTGLTPDGIRWSGEVAAPPYHRPQGAPVALRWARVVAEPGK